MKPAARVPRMKISVIVPTYRRIPDLKKCLAALACQERRADEILVVVQESDRETWEFAKSSEILRVFFVSLKGTGQVAALNRGLEEAAGDVVCFTDDDAAPVPDWLLRIEQTFDADPRAGAVGGRDRMWIGGKLQEGRAGAVGLITWYGRITGNHHLGFGPARSADHLKGVNMSYRRKAVDGIRFDESLRGRAQYRNDFAFSSAVKNRGWKILYDPEIVADHYLAARSDDAQRGQFLPGTVRDESFNECLAILKYFPRTKKIQGILWNFLIGNVAMPGILQACRRQACSRAEMWRRMKAAYTGRFEAFRKVGKL